MEIVPCCNQPKSLSGIETSTIFEQKVRNESCNQPKSLSGIETRGLSSNFYVQMIVAINLNPYQGLKLETFDSKFLLWDVELQST